MNWKNIQSALLAHGFDPKGIDGIPGRNTLAALKAFQRFAGIPLSGEADYATVAALGLTTAQLPDPPWMELLATKMGLHEKRNNSALSAFLKSDGKTLGDPSVLPWCGDLVETCIALTLPGEVLPGNPYLARNWSRFGMDSAPLFGCVASFWRGGPQGTSGHVGFLVGERADAFRVRGGNQSNAITDTWIAKDRLIAARRPKTWNGRLAPLPRVTASGGLSTNEA